MEFIIRNLEENELKPDLKPTQKKEYQLKQEEDEKSENEILEKVEDLFTGDETLYFKNPQIKTIPKPKQYCLENTKQSLVEEKQGIQDTRLGVTSLEPKNESTLKLDKFPRVSLTFNNCSDISINFK